MKLRVMMCSCCPAQHSQSYWAVYLSICSLACTAHSFACYAMLASLVRSAALIRSFARLLTYSGAQGNLIFVYGIKALISKFQPTVCRCRNACAHSWFWPRTRVFAVLLFRCFFKKKKWNSFRLGYQVKLLQLNPGSQMNLFGQKARERERFFD